MNETLHDAFVDEIKDLYNAEKQLTKALPKLAKNATSETLREALEAHLAETDVHIQRLEQIFELLDEKPRGKHCAGMAGIIEEGNAMLEEDFEGAVMDACIIAAGQRSEHYEMAAYGTCVAWAEALGLTEAAGLLNETLAEEKAADQKLSAIAEGDINEAASAGAGDDDEDEDAKAPASKQTSQPAARASKSAKSPAASRRRAN
ncbi:MAG: ferritin-like domain-containing protein [Acidobacteriota bacterium]|nr:ferritin-like domain-containing protein [Acidobacteriota bacterium]